MDCFASHDTVTYFLEEEKIGECLQTCNYLWDLGIAESIFVRTQDCFVKFSSC